MLDTLIVLTDHECYIHIAFVIHNTELAKSVDIRYRYQNMKLTQYQLQQQMGVRYREDIGKWIRFKIKKEPV